MSGKATMRIGIDLQFTAASHTGTGVYAETLAADLVGLPGNTVEWVAFTEAASLPASLAGRAEHRRIPVPGLGRDRELERRLLWASAVSGAGLDVYFAPTGIAPADGCCPSVITVHDLLFEHEPGYYAEPLLRFLKREMPRSVRCAERIIAISEFSRQDLIDTYGTDPEKIAVLHQRLGDDFREPPSREVVRKILGTLGISGPYVLTLSNQAPHKNTPFALEVFARWIEDRPSTRHKLVVAGGGGAPQIPSDLGPRIKALGLQDRVLPTGRVERRLLPALYAGADAFLFPSLFEGWGLPPLEAMAMGTPVLVSDRGALPEAVGKAGAILPLDDPRAWAGHLDALVKRPLLADAMKARKERLFESNATALMQILEQARDMDLGRRSISAPASPVSPKERKPEDARIAVAYAADWHSPSGFGVAARLHAHALQAQGVDVVRVDSIRDATQLPDLALPGRDCDGISGGDLPVIRIHHGSPDQWDLRKGDYNIGFFVWETDKIPGNGSHHPKYDWVRILDGVDEIWTASTFTQDVLAASGVERPCQVFAHPIDASFYCPGPRRLPLETPPKGFDPTWTVFAYVGTWDVRKRPDDILRAYFQAFRRNDRVLLVLKTRFPEGMDGPALIRDLCWQARETLGIEEQDTPAFEVCTGLWPPERLRDLYRSANAFVTATRGEGFGLCAAESMSCGTPLIATRFSATGDYLSDETGYPVSHRLESVPSDSIFPWFQSDQRWGVPDIEALAQSMRSVHESRAEARAKGTRARQLVLARYAPQTIGQAMCRRLEAIRAGRADAIAITETAEEGRPDRAVPEGPTC